ncbi:MAG: EscU/YscU/HrcU family type III secretion system export apparatus switch protein [Chitinispirillales bacterium]|jgi:flagellar biosynthesis protein|nr:EscU/YscU/HrcU family type III secretion system export apparatus switch protein [Chitinispirillales bacterium]
MAKKVRDSAVALRYNEEEDRAPKVVAKGFGLNAEKIRELAVKSGVPVKKDDALVELLAQIDIDREIPPQLYAAVAEVLALVYKASNSLGQQEKK